jgi:hypothetical protein
MLRVIEDFNVGIVKAPQSLTKLQHGFPNKVARTMWCRWVARRVLCRVETLISEWKKLSAEYSEARERFEATSSAVAARRESYATPTVSELAENKAARVALRTATQRLYDFLARNDLADDG